MLVTSNTTSVISLERRKAPVKKWNANVFKLLFVCERLTLNECVRAVSQQVRREGTAEKV